MISLRLDYRTRRRNLNLTHLSVFSGVDLTCRYVACSHIRSVHSYFLFGLDVDGMFVSTDFASSTLAVNHHFILLIRRDHEKFEWLETDFHQFLEYQSLRHICDRCRCNLLLLLFVR